MANIKLLTVPNQVKLQVALVGVLLAFIVSRTSDACSVPPSHWGASVEDMVWSTPTIVLARAVREEEDENWRIFHFEPVSSLKGGAAETFSLRTEFGEYQRYGDYSQHQDPLFWGRTLAGNYIDPGSCTAYGMFAVGETYLLFLGGPDYPKSFELIRSEEDFWLRVVTATVEAVDQQVRAIRELSSE